MELKFGTDPNWRAGNSKIKVPSTRNQIFDLILALSADRQTILTKILNWSVRVHIWYGQGSWTVESENERPDFYENEIFNVIYSL